MRQLIAVFWRLMEPTTVVSIGSDKGLLLATKPVLEPILVYCWTDSWERISKPFESEYSNFIKESVSDIVEIPAIMLVPTANSPHWIMSSFTPIQPRSSYLPSVTRLNMRKQNKFSQITEIFINEIWFYRSDSTWGYFHSDQSQVRWMFERVRIVLIENGSTKHRSQLRNLFLRIKFILRCATEIVRHSWPEIQHGRCNESIDIWN